MAWEKRNRNGLYYYSARREGKSVRKIYVGKGARAQELARQVQQRKAAREAERRAIEQLEARLWPPRSRMQLIREGCRQAFHASHYVAGYRLTKSYNWLPWRGPVKNTSEHLLAAQESATMEQALPTTIEETLRLLKAGRRELLPHLRFQLSQVPQLWRHCGDLGRLTQAAWARAIAGDDDLVRESLMLVSDQLPDDLTDDATSPASQLMAERVVLTRMQLAFFEQLEDQDAIDIGNARYGEFVNKRLNSANHQYRESVRQLDKVRRLESETARKPGQAAALKIYNPKLERKTA